MAFWETEVEFEKWVGFGSLFLWLCVSGGRWVGGEVFNVKEAVDTGVCASEHIWGEGQWKGSTEKSVFSSFPPILKISFLVPEDVKIEDWQ